MPARPARIFPAPKKPYGPSFFAAKADPYEAKRAVMRMSWDAPNLFNVWQRNIGPLKGEYNFSRTRDTIFQNQFYSKKQLRGYWGQRVKERGFRRWYLPSSLPVVVSGEKTNPNLSTTIASATKFARPGKEGGRREIEKEKLYRYHAAQAPVGPFMFREVERRLDVVLHRACFASTQIEATKLVRRGHVRLNGNIERQPQIRLLPGDFLEVNPAALRILSRPPPTQVGLAGTRSLGLDFDPIEAWSVLLREYAGLTDEAQIAEIANGGKFKGMTLEEWEAGRVTTEDGKTVVDTRDGEETMAVEEQDEEDDVEPPVSTKTSELDASVDDVASATASDDLSTTSFSDPSSSPSFPKHIIARIPPTSFKPLTPTHFPPLPTDPKGTLHFHLPAYSGPNLFVPAYLQPNWEYCTVTYLRHPAARHNYCEIPSPFNAKGDVMRAGWEWYQARKIRMKSYPGGLYPGGIDARARLSKLRGPEVRRTGVHEDFY